MGVTSTENNPVNEITRDQAEDHYKTGNGSDVHVDRTYFMNNGPGSVVQVENFKAITDLQPNNYPVGTVISLGGGAKQPGLQSDEYKHSYYSSHGVTSSEAYIYGHATFLAKGTIEVLPDGKYKVDLDLRPYDNNFDFQGNNQGFFLETLRSIGSWFTGKGTKYEIEFRGSGKGKVIQGTYTYDDLIDQHCFPAGTLITLADGSRKAIEKITTSDRVLTFDDGGNPCVGEVVRTYTNTTPEFIRLVFEDGRDDLIATPGHAFLTETGDYLELGHLARLGGGTVRLVDVDGAIVTAKAVRFVYSSETAHLFVTSSTRSMTQFGNLAFKENVTEGWATHNFEVRTNHNYVAGNIRVHNDSGVLGQVGNSIDGGLDRLLGGRDGDGSFRDKVTDLIGGPFHAAGKLVNGALKAVASVASGFGGTVANLAL